MRLPARAGKYNAVRTTVDGVTFDSRGEAALYCQLVMLRSAGEVDYFLRQVPITLPGGVTYRVDFQVFLSSGGVRYLDFKGAETPEFKIKKKLVEAIYPFRIELVRMVRGRLSGL